MYLMTCGVSHPWYICQCQTAWKMIGKMHDRRCSKLNSLRALLVIVVITTTASYFYLFTTANTHEDSTIVTGKSEYSGTVLKVFSEETIQLRNVPVSTTEQSSFYLDLHTSLKPSKRDVPTIQQFTNHLQMSTPTKHSSLDLSTSPMSNSYVLAESYWEQQTSGCRNLQNLQCWAGKYGMRVVEPFVEKSVLHTPFVTMKPSALKFSHMFDLECWNMESSKLGNSKLVQWNMFVQQAPRDLIVVQVNYNSASDNNNKTRLSQNSSKPRYLQGCPNIKNWPNDKQMTTLTKLKFNIVRRVCINFEYKDSLTLDEFHNVIFGEYGDKSASVLFRQWRGLGTGRILVKKGGCSNTGIQENMQVSKRVIRDAESYTHKYLSSRQDGDTHTTRNESAYIAIIARLEKSKITFQRREGIIPFCFEQLLSYHSKVVRASSLSRTFLAIDIGKYGSHSFRNTGDSSDLDEEFRKFFRKLYGNELSISDWEGTFEDVSHTTDPGYIALLQKVIATKADCIIFVGGGSFQKHALKLYQSNHQLENWCIHIVKECTLEKSLPFSS